jgi:DNA-binding CsgD family transcriptional regulator
MARAKAQGKHIGRPPLGAALRDKIVKHLAAGLSAYAIGKRLGIDPHTVDGRPFDGVNVVV